MPLDGQSGKACQALNLSQETCLVCGYDLRCIGYSLLISENSCTYKQPWSCFFCASNEPDGSGPGRPLALMGSPCGLHSHLVNAAFSEEGRFIFHARLYHGGILRMSTVEIKRRGIGVLVGAIARCI